MAAGMRWNMTLTDSEKAMVEAASAGDDAECEVCVARKSRQRAGERLCRFCEFGTCFEENDQLVCRSCDKVNGDS